MVSFFDDRVKSCGGSWREACTLVSSLSYEVWILFIMSGVYELPHPRSTGFTSMTRSRAMV